MYRATSATSATMAIPTISKADQIPLLVRNADEPKADFVQRLVFSARAYKGQLTKAVDAAERLAPVISASPTSESVGILKDSMATISRNYRYLEQRMTELLTESTDDEEYEKHQKDLDSYYKKYFKAWGDMQDAIEQAQIRPARRITDPPAAAAGGGAAGGGAAAATKANLALKPKDLLSTNTPLELRTWIQKFRSYYSTSNFAKLEVEDQQAYFLESLDTALRFKLEKMIDGTTPIFGDNNSCTSYLKNIFLKLYPLFGRRLQFFRFMQSKGQKLSEYIIKVRRMYDEADIHDLTNEELLLFKILAGTIDEELRQELLKLKDLTIRDLEDAVTEWEVMKQSNKDIKGQPTLNQASQSKGGKQSQTKNLGSAKRALFQKLKDKCKRCARDHKGEDCKYKDATCHNCGMKGHIKPACYRPSGSKSGSSGSQSKKSSKDSRSSSRASSAQSSAASSRDTSPSSDTSDTGKASQVTHRVNLVGQSTNLQDPTPRLDCLIVPTSGNRPGTPFRFEVLPDTGATITVISHDIAKSNGMTIKKANNERLLTADNNNMNVYGSTRFNINGTWIRALVSKSLTEEILLGWRDMQRLGIISPVFPQPQSTFNSNVCTVVDPTTQSDIECRQQLLLKEFKDTLSDELPEIPMAGPEMTIDFKDNVNIKPKLITTTKETPIHFAKAADELTEKLLKDGVIERVPLDEVSDWISPGFFVPKEGGKGGVRLVTDFTRLNKYIKRPVHPFPSAADITKKIKPTARFFAKLDAVQGYHQIPLAKSSRPLTTFLLPSGKFRYLRGPMGLRSTNDHWCARSDQTIVGIPDAHKIVDDILCVGETVEELFATIREVLTRCKSIRLTISKKKLKIGKEIKFAGYILTETGVQPDPELISAIKDYPSPTDVTGVRSFLGLANQLGHFITDLATSTTNIRGLLKKNVAFNWLPEHEREFRAVKTLLTSPLLVHFFDESLPTSLLTDASKLNGMGFALVQTDSKGHLRLIQAGSRTLTSAEKNYAPVELECLAAVWAITKCRHFLYGCPDFKLITDHQPLVGIFNKDLHEIENRRLLRLREKVLDYHFQTEWVEGKSHLIADALSRNPVNVPLAQGYVLASVLVCHDPTLERLRKAAADCPSYRRLIEAIRTTSLDDLKKLSPTDPAYAFKHVWSDLSVSPDHDLVLYQTDRLVIPDSERPRILDLLHQGHSGITKTRTLAKQLYYWPGLSTDIKQLVTNCSVCFELLPKQPATPLQQTASDYPLEHTSVDLFSLRGKDYLAYADRYSGMLWCDKLSSTTTLAVTNLLDKWMLDFGYPLTIRSDGGPQFRGPFKDWCESKDILHEVSSPYHPQSNGHAEQAVKSAKHLLEKLDANMRKFKEHLFAWRNTPRSDGFSPNDLFFGRRLRSTLPAVRPPMSTTDPSSTRTDRREKQKSAFDAHTRALPPLSPGDCVVIRDPASHAWVGEGTVVQARRPDGLSYDLKMKGDGSLTTRNRKWLRLQTDKRVSFPDV